MNKAVNNNYTYVISEESGSLTFEQEAYANKFAKETLPKDTKATSISFGYGVESKFVLSKSVFLRLNGEFNVSSAFLGVSSEDTYGYQEYKTIDEDLKDKSKTLTMFRNILLFGFGVGVLL